MISDLAPPREAYVWVWLPGATEPIVAGRLASAGDEIDFIYGRSYRERTDAIPLYMPELPLVAGPIRPERGLVIANAIRDAAPDAWGRRVILNRLLGRGADLDAAQLDELTFLLSSGSDRAGALDFQASARDYVPRGSGGTLDELIRSAERVEHNIPLTPELDQALHHGSSIGGARPKALITAGDTKYIAKFSSGNDSYNVVKGEYVAMRLAAIAGIDVAPVRLEHAAGKDILLVERFDRVHEDAGWTRRAMVSALTMLGLSEMEARYASYQDLAEEIRRRFAEPQRMLHELFARMMFNILVGNVDDHARNHAAFWNGHDLRLTPAYDICPQGRAGEEASQAMLIHDDVRASQLGACIAAAPHFHLSEARAIEIADAQLRVIAENWRAVCDEAQLGEIDRRYFWGRQFLNPYAFYSLPPAAADLEPRARAWREQMS
ncbi:serine/threonine-protein kinase HipA [Sphingopyxis sp. YR583]|uniref:type II toxin-antitoxin system HipA family toxin n=1 Tax=Sphingopyxis sp. YR583 TaxID=1881047 RepID=UPI0008A803B7|nr:HipA domain-containing protein [Sphingopyxis sp. YR583]SEH12794.1 serine/threonine-protein kinase HipA [Sphingopyxis sp. YR583]